MAFSQDCPELVSKWNKGPVSTVTSQGNYLYLGAGANFIIADVRDPSNPIILSKVSLEDYIQDINIKGEHAYVSNESTGFWIINISDPSDPIVEGIYNPYNAVLTSQVSGSYVFLGCQPHFGLQVVDLGNVSSPSWVTAIDIDSSVYAMKIHGDILYLLDQYWGLFLYDISNPFIPLPLGSIRVSAPYSMDIQWPFVIVDRIYEFYVFDVTDPMNPVEVSNCFHEKPMGIMQANESTLYFSWSGLTAWDITDPKQPELIGRVLNSDLIVTDFYIEESILYAVVDGQVVIFDITNLIDPVQVGEINFSGRSKGISCNGNTGYLANGTSGLEIFELSDPDNPQVIGSYNATGDIADVLVEGNYAYLADEGFGLRVIDVSNSAQPVEMGNVSFDLFPSIMQEEIKLYKGNNIVYIQGASTYYVDVSVPGNPIYLGALSGAYDMDVDSRYVYIANRTWFEIWDMSVPQNPQQLTTYLGDGEMSYFDYVAVYGIYAYLKGKDGLYVVDISDKQHPVQVNLLNSFAADDLIVMEIHYPYLIAGYGWRYRDNLKIYDLADPINPAYMDAVIIPERISDLDSSGSQLYIAAESVGFYQYNLSGCSQINRDAPICDLSFDYGGWNYPFYPGVPVEFKDISTNYPTSWVWDFGDGTISTEKDPIHTFTESGLYKVTLTVGNAYGSDSKSCYWIVYDIFGMGCPRHLGTLLTNETIETCEITNDTLYLSEGKDSFLVVDVSTPSFPKYLNTIEIEGDVRDFLAYNEILYVASGTRLYIFDISTPSNPIVLSVIETESELYHISYSANILITLSLNDLTTYDFSNPINPVFRGSCEISDWLDIYTAPTMNVRGDFVFVFFNRDLFIYDVVSQMNPILISIYGDGDWHPIIAAGAVEKTMAYVNQGESDGIDIVDVSNLENPEIVGNLQVPLIWNSIVDIDSTEGLLFVGGNILLVYDLSNLQAPYPIGEYVEQVSKIFVMDNMLVVIGPYAGNTGVHLFDLSGCSMRKHVRPFSGP